MHEAAVGRFWKVNGSRQIVKGDQNLKSNQTGGEDVSLFILLW